VTASTTVSAITPQAIPMMLMRVTSDSVALRFERANRSAMNEASLSWRRLPGNVVLVDEELETAGD